MSYSESRLLVPSSCWYCTAVLAALVCRVTCCVTALVATAATTATASCCQYCSASITTSSSSSAMLACFGIKQYCRYCSLLTDVHVLNLSMPVHQLRGGPNAWSENARGNWLGGNAVTGDIAESFTVPFGEQVRKALAARRSASPDNPWAHCDAAMWRLDTVKHGAA
jgi:hypothetical protein